MGRRAGLRGPWGHGPGHQARRPHMVAQAQKRMLSPGGQTPSKRQDAGTVINRASMGHCLRPHPHPIHGVFSPRACVSVSVLAKGPSPVDGDPPRRPYLNWESEATLGGAMAAGREIKVREGVGVCLSCWQQAQESGQSEGVKLSGHGLSPGDEDK